MFIVDEIKDKDAEILQVSDGLLLSLFLKYKIFVLVIFLMHGIKNKNTYQIPKDFLGLDRLDYLFFCPISYSKQLQSWFPVPWIL